MRKFLVTTVLIVLMSFGCSDASANREALDSDDDVVGGGEDKAEDETEEQPDSEKEDEVTIRPLLYNYAPDTITVYMYNKDLGELEKSAKSLFVYNERGQIEKRMYSRYQAGIWSEPWSTEEYIYNADGQLTQMIINISPEGDDQFKSNYLYNADGTLQSFIFSECKDDLCEINYVTTYTYEDGRLLTQTKEDNTRMEIPPIRSVYSYNEDGGLIKKMLYDRDEKREDVWSAESIHTYQYDNNSHLTSILFKDQIDDERELALYDYNNNGTVAQIQDIEHTGIEDFLYEEGRLKSITKHDGNGEVFMQWEYTFTNAGNSSSYESELRNAYNSSGPNTPLTSLITTYYGHAPLNLFEETE